MLYGEAADLHYAGRKLQSEHGVQQGCAHGTLYFCGGEVQVLAELKQRFQDVLFVAICDDLYILGALARAAAAFAAWHELTAAAHEAAT